MLWEEVIKAPDYPDIDIRNTLRRILENYFKMFGGKDKWELSTPSKEARKLSVIPYFIGQMMVHTPF